MRRTRLAAVAAVVLGFVVAPARSVACGEDPPAERPVDLALCLDTSNSMDDLIDAAKRRLWDVVNDLAHASPRPRLRVALLSYGNTTYPAADGWVRTDTPFTEDLDLVSEKLFALRTRGGTELVGRVVDAAVTGLRWSDDPAALRICVVAGNESADQDREVTAAFAARRAAKRGVFLDAVYCGAASDAIAPGWRDVAGLGLGEFAAIDASRPEPVAVTPYDKLLGALSTSLNTTYLPFGRHGAAGYANQAAQDGNAASLGEGEFASRGGTKASDLYRNGSWDLVDACRDKEVDVAKLPANELPAAMRALTAEERESYVAEMAKKRAEIRRQIADLVAKRDAYIAAEKAKQGLAQDESLGGALRRAVRKQAGKKGFTFDVK